MADVRKAEGENPQEIEEDRPAWSVMMEEVGGMMEEALEVAHGVLIGFIGAKKSIESELIVHTAISIFEATVNAEGARRILEAQKAASPLSMPRQVIKVDHEGKPIY